MRPHQRVFLYLLIVLAGIITPPGAQSQRPKRLVETLDVEGNYRLSDEDILSHIKTLPGQPFSEKRIQRDLQAILELGVFDKVGTRVMMDRGLRGGVVVIFSVMELPLILDVRFKGFKGIGVEESIVIEVLREKQINLARDEVYDPVKLNAARRVIQEILASRGVENMTVHVRQEVSRTHTSIEFFVRDEP